MKVKLDENLPASLRGHLAATGHDADTVVEEGLGGARDEEVLRAATASGRLILTLDRGVGSLARRSGPHPGVVVFRLPDQRAPLVEAALRKLLATYSLEELAGSIAIVEPDRLRLSRPAERSGQRAGGLGRDERS